MLLPNEMKPESSIFYYAAIILKEIQNNEDRQLVTVFRLMKAKYDISLRVFSYCLDWLYLIEAVAVNEEGEILICT
ncbi:ABC-three component system middle component 6 [Paenibacillus sp. SGZ-1009]|uniref:ABC-three component system middle component 6 n=1 Tax=Paenibacillus campi TaxID=3106031 RepID=UPI002AFF7482|nr:ABC-three component system middle component 6 [Paenibacillus sp. SGZ-1009]